MAPSCETKRERPAYDLADILREHLEAYRQQYRLSYQQLRAVNAILKCRTAAMGGLLKACNVCGKWDYSFFPCKNRHCPKCGAFEKARWLEAQKRWLLPVPYFHTVFTIDHVFNPLIWRNQKVLYTLLFHTAARQLQAYGRKYLKGDIGFTMVLHTWGQRMQAHPHVHVIITGGALVKTADGYRWQPAKKTWLFPVKKLSRDFRRAFCEGIRQLWQDGELETEGLDTSTSLSASVEAMLAEAGSRKWEVFIEKPPVGKVVEHLLDYLARYAYRIAISNYRIVKFAKGKVTFEYYDNRDDGKLKELTLTAVEFIRRFLLHVLPRGFHRIRHYGLHSSGARAKLKQARRLLALPGEVLQAAKLKLDDWLDKIAKDGQDPRLCPHCGKGRMVTVREFEPVENWTTKLRLRMAGFFGGLLFRWGLA